MQRTLCRCVPIGRLADRLNVRPKLLNDLIAAGKVKTHEHGTWTTISKDSADELTWQLALAKAS